MKRILKSVLAAVFAPMLSAPVIAITDCQSTIAYIWTGDAGTVTVFMANGGSFSVSPGDANQKNVMASASLALALGTQVIVRYVASGVACAAPTARTDVQGMFIMGSRNAVPAPVPEPSTPTVRP